LLNFGSLLCFSFRHSVSVFIASVYRLALVRHPIFCCSVLVFGFRRTALVRCSVSVFIAWLWLVAPFFVAPFQFLSRGFIAWYHRSVSLLGFVARFCRSVLSFGHEKDIRCITAAVQLWYVCLWQK
jgi:hypothetical protein